MSVRRQRRDGRVRRSMAVLQPPEVLEARQVLATVSVDVGGRFQSVHPDWAALSGTGTSGTVASASFALGGRTVTAAVSGTSLSWIDASAAHTVVHPLNLVYRDGVGTTATATVSLSGLAAGASYSLTLASVNYLVAGSAASPTSATFAIDVTDATRTAVTVATGTTATRASVASADRPAVSFTAKSDGTAAIAVRRTGTSGTAVLNGFRLSDGAAVVDTTPPAGTVAFAKAPQAVEAGVPAVTLVASPLADPSGVQYWFENVADPSRTSGWIDVSSWTDFGLPPGSTQSYRFRARDNAATPNVTGWSAAASVTTSSGTSFAGFTAAEIGSRRPAFDFTGMRNIPAAPAAGVHPRVFTTTEERPALRRRLATTTSGQEVMAEIAAYTRLLTVGQAGYVRTEPYAVDAWGNARLSNVGANDVSTSYAALLAYDWTASPRPANPLPVTSTGDPDTGKRDQLASILTLAAYEAWLYRGQPEYDQRAADIARVMETWARLVVDDPGYGASTAGWFGATHMALAYDFNYDVLTTAQRDLVRRGIIAGTWTPAMNYGFDAVPYATTSNWSTLNDFVPIQLMAVEGEAGAYPDSYFRDFIRTQYNFLTYGWYDSGAPNEGLGKNYQFLATQETFARRGYFLAGHPHVRAYVGNYLPAITQPFGNAFSESDDWGGTGRVDATGDWKFQAEDAVGARWLYPTSPTTSFVLTNFMAVNSNANPYAAYYWSNPLGQRPFVPNGYVNNLLSGAIQALDVDPTLAQPTAFEAAARAANDGETTFVESDRGLVYARSGFGVDAARLEFSARQDLGGHTHADRNNFNFSALGRTWAVYRTEGSTVGPTGNVVAETQYHSGVLIDGLGQGLNSYQVAKQGGKLVSVVDTAAATFAAGDAKVAYDWTWATNVGSLVTPGPQDAFVTESLNDFRTTKSAEPWYAEPLADRPSWRGMGFDEAFLKTPFNPMRSAYRTTALVKGSRPYALVLDDYRKDDATHRYSWLMQVPNDLVVESTVVGGTTANYRNDVILAEKSGTRRLLVRILQADGVVNPATPATLEVYDEPRRSGATWQRLRIDADAVAPNFKVMLFPFRQGETLPVTSLAAGTFTTTVDGRADVLQFTAGADGRTRSTLSQSGGMVVGEPAATAPAAPTGLTAVPISQSAVVLSWADRSTNEQIFRIERSTDGATWTPVGSVLAGITTYTDTSVAAGTSYRYRMVAANALSSPTSPAVLTRVPAAGRFLISQVGQRYDQSFDRLSSSAVHAKVWAGDAWLPGWSLARPDATDMRFTDGSTTTARPGSYGSSATTAATPNAAERAFGGIPATGQYQAQGILFENALDGPVTQLTVAYAVEQWRRNTAGSMQFYFKTQATNPVFDLASTVGWTEVAGTAFTAATGTAAVLDGNAAANRAVKTAVMSVTVPAGQFLWLGWRITGGATLGIDDLSVQFAPAATIAVASGTQTQTQAGHPLLIGSVPYEKTGGGALVLDQTNPLTGSITVKAGLLRIAKADALASGRLVVASGGQATVAPGLTAVLGGLDVASGPLDIGAGGAVVLAGLTASDTVAAIVAGRGDGGWTGSSGLTSAAVRSDLAAGRSRTIGWTVDDAGAVTVTYAAAGDTDLDGMIDVLDAANVLAGGRFDSGEETSWGEGDFNHDRLADVLDVAEFLATGLFDAGPYGPT